MLFTNARCISAFWVFFVSLNCSNRALSLSNNDNVGKGIFMHMSAHSLSPNSVSICTHLQLPDAWDVNDFESKLCIYLAEGSNEGFPASISKCFTLPDTTRISKFCINVDGFNPGTFKFISIIIKQDTGQIFSNASILYDVLHGSYASSEFLPPDWSAVVNFRRFEGTRNLHETSPPDSFVLAIFFKDLHAHGCNHRMLRTCTQTEEFLTRMNVKLPIYVIIPSLIEIGTYDL